MKSVTDRLPVANNERRGPVMLLSGDVHIAFASRMLYKATRRFGETSGPPTTSAIRNPLSQVKVFYSFLTNASISNFTC